MTYIIHYIISLALFFSENRVIVCPVLIAVHVHMSSFLCSRPNSEARLRSETLRKGRGRGAGFPPLPNQTLIWNLLNHDVGFSFRCDDKGCISF